MEGEDGGDCGDFSVTAAGEPVQVRDVHAMLLHLAGLEQDRLTSLQTGQCRKPTDIGGRAIWQRSLVTRRVTTRVWGQ